MASKNFYTSIFDFELVYANRWLVHLTSQQQQMELGIVKINVPEIPKFFDHYPQEFYLKFFALDVDDFFETALHGTAIIIKEPHNTHCGRRRCLLKDIDGTFVDVSTMVPTLWHAK